MKSIQTLWSNLISANLNDQKKKEFVLCTSEKEKDFFLLLKRFDIILFLFRISLSQ